MVYISQNSAIAHGQTVQDTLEVLHSVYFYLVYTSALWVWVFHIILWNVRYVSTPFPKKKRSTAQETVRDTTKVLSHGFHLAHSSSQPGDRELLSSYKPPTYKMTSFNGIKNWVCHVCTYCACRAFPWNAFRFMLVNKTQEEVHAQEACRTDGQTNQRRYSLVLEINIKLALSGECR